jgi:hypothetical protein
VPTTAAAASPIAVAALLPLLLLQVEHATASRVRDLEKQLDAEHKRAEVWGMERFERYHK